MTLRDTVASDLATVIAHGGQVPDEYFRLTSRAETFTLDRRAFTKRFADSVVTGADENEILQLRALALIEVSASPVHHAELRKVLREHVDRVTDDLYAGVAEDNWKTIADQFDSAATALTKAHTIVPATTNPANLVTASPNVRKAWAEGQTQSSVLDGLVEPLLAAARLAGLDAAGTPWGIGATVRTDGLHRRRVWEAWESGNRWTALLDLGATIQAPELYDLEPYREPAPIEIRLEQRGIGWANVEYDPEDNIPTSAFTAEAVENHLNGIPTP